jgi:hypothetical protein
MIFDFEKGWQCPRCGTPETKTANKTEIEGEEAPHD